MARKSGLLPVRFTMRARLSMGLAALGVFSALSLRAQLTWEADRASIDLQPGQKSARTAFNFKNTGTEPVTIHRVSSSCDCTVPTLEKKFYRPGESGRIAVEYKAGKSSGIRSIIVESSSRPSAQRLILEVNILPLAEISPREITWGVGEPPVEKQQLVTVSKKHPTEILGVASENRNFKVELDALETGHRYLVKIRPIDTGKISSGKIRFKTSGLEIPASFARIMEKKAEQP
jgi:hypothetical protein